MNTKPIQVVHSDIPITYNEGENRWTFTLRGRDRSAESLAKAKEYIDKPLPPEKAKPFEKIPAWFFEFQSTPKKVEITGIAEGRGYGSNTQYVWINAPGKRSKEPVHNIVPSNKKNDELINDILAEITVVDEAKKAIAKFRSRLDPLVLPKDE